VDCGAKHNILRSLLVRNINVIRVAYDYDFSADDHDVDGLLLSNGPGDPTDVPVLIETVRKYLAREKPIFGICLGHQILALAAGGATYKLRYGHRSQNQPVFDLFSRKSYITSQNHGYAVDREKLPEGFEEWFVNVNDSTCEGIRHRRQPWLSVQFHPEAYPGPVDSAVLFDEFVDLLHRR
jgi:carbamoyl-phosphate synthase small subunit